MKDNARHAPGSNKSRFPAFLASLATPVRSKNAVKIRSKCSQNRGCHFFSACVSTIYNFTALKCLHFPVYPDHARNLNRNLRLFSRYLRVPVSPFLGASGSIPSRLCAFASIPRRRNKVLTTIQNEK